MRINIFVSRRREFEFGIAVGIDRPWLNNGGSYVSIRFSFGKRSLVIVSQRSNAQRELEDSYRRQAEDEENQQKEEDMKSVW